MLNGIKLKNLYSKIQTELFYMIPENWDKIYLYASVIEDEKHYENGEMFFYYYPKGLLKKNPVNVYEVPSKFNIDENSYMKLVNNLYNTIKLLRKEFKNAEDNVWTNLTISIENLKFHIEYNYENLDNSIYSDEDRHIIWQHKYLGLSPERLPKKDRKMLEQYLLNERFKSKQVKSHTENMYKQNVHNIIEYDREQNEVEYEKEEKNIENNVNGPETRKLDKYELYKQNKGKQNKELQNKELQNKELQNKQIQKSSDIIETPVTKNQILNI